VPGPRNGPCITSDGEIPWRPSGETRRVTRAGDRLPWHRALAAYATELPYLRCHLDSAYAWIGEIDPGTAELAEVRTLRGDGYSRIRQVEDVGYFGVPIVNDLYVATFFAGSASSAYRNNEPNPPLCCDLGR
jgi:hypothetical protein